MNILAQLKAQPARFGAGAGDIISAEGLGEGPYFLLKAVGADAVISSADLPNNWSGSLAGKTISEGDELLLPGVANVGLTSGTVAAYRIAPPVFLPSDPVTDDFGTLVTDDFGTVVTN